MSCCCDTHPLLGALNGLMGALPSESRVRVGFEFDYNLAYNPAEIEATQVTAIESALRYYLDDGVTFRNVHVAVQPRGRIAKGYITVSANTNIDLPSEEVFGDMVQYGIEQYLPRIKWTRRDATLIDSFGPAPQTTTGTQQTTQTQQQQQSRNLPPPPPGQCDWDTQDFGDYVACLLGIKSAVGGVAAGAAGALVGVGALTILAVVLLKR